MRYTFLNHKNTPFSIKDKFFWNNTTFFFQLKIYKHLFNHSYLVIMVSFPFTFHNLHFEKVCVEEKAGKLGLRALTPLLSKISIDEANFPLIKNITRPHCSPRSTRHAQRIKVFCCLMIFCIDLKVFVQGDVSAHEKILIFGSITSWHTRKRCSVSQRNGPLT